MSSWRAPRRAAEPTGYAAAREEAKTPWSSSREPLARGARRREQAREGARVWEQNTMEIITSFPLAGSTGGVCWIGGNIYP